MQKKHLPLIIAAVFVVFIAAYFLYFKNKISENDVFQEAEQAPIPAYNTANAQPKTCPDSSLIIAETTKWKGPGSWESTEAPINTKVGRFIEAQWQGYKIGEVICRYESTQAHTFPIEILRKIGKTVLEPRSDHWVKIKSGVKSCKSRFPSDCLFYDVKRKKHNPYDDVFQQRR